jgi:glycerophosphoryl diester phosphodiesterase
MKKIIFFIFLISASLTTHANTFSVLRTRLSGRIAGAHQGGLLSSHWPNTLPAFEYAYNVGADVVEMDLHLTKDNVVVVYHDDDLKTWTNCKGLIHDKTLAEIQACRFTLAPHARIPTYEEVLEWSQGKIIVDAEFKDFESIKPAIDLVKKYEAYSWTYFQAQNNREKYQQAHDYDSSIALLYTIHSEDDLKWALAQDETLMIVEVDSQTRSREIIDQVHASGKLVTEDSWHFSPINSQELFASACKKAFEFGIDIAISNRPKGCVKKK